MKVKLSTFAAEDIAGSYEFYESQQEGLGDYFLDSLFADIDSLAIYAGIHRVVFGSHRLLAKTFPYALYYESGGGGLGRDSSSTLGEIHEAIRT